MAEIDPPDVGRDATRPASATDLPAADVPPADRRSADRPPADIPPADVPGLPTLGDGTPDLDQQVRQLEAIEIDLRRRLATLDGR